MALKLFLISFIMIILLQVSQTKHSKENIDFFQMDQATEYQRIKFFWNSFKSFDANKDGFVTSNELYIVDFKTSQLPFVYLAIDTMTEILKQKYKVWGYYPTKIAVTFKDYKDAMERKLGQINSFGSTPAGKHRCNESSLLFIIVFLLFIIVFLLASNY